MYYAPHELYRKREREKRDAHNRIVSSSSCWEYVCDCRCDDNTTQKFEDQNGRTYIPKYKIVCSRSGVREGDYVQCRWKGTGDVRGEGRVQNVPSCNYLDYMTAYV